MNGFAPVAESPGWPVHVACLWEAAARKVGNVHRARDFADLTFPDLALSGAALAHHVDAVAGLPAGAPGRTVGNLVWRAVADARRHVASNANLGIVLLLAPLALAAGDLRPGVGEVLARLTVEDAAQVYAAIRLANPGGLGRAEDQDVAQTPTVTLLEAMRLAAHRDAVAAQYANGFANVFDFGVPALLDGVRAFGSVEAGIIGCQLAWLARHPDSLIARKNGVAAAEGVRESARGVLAAGGLTTPAGRAAGVALDARLRADGHRLNPGTTADLVAACLYVALRTGRLAASTPFPWPATDWI